MSANTIDLLQMIRLQALHDKLHPDEDATYRKIFRWYSKTFHTPLYLVAELPLLEVLQCYFDNMFEEMEPEHLEYEIEQSLKTPEQIAAEKAEKISSLDKLQKEDDDFFNQVSAEAGKLLAPQINQGPGIVAPDKSGELPPSFTFAFDESDLPK